MIVTAKLDPIPASCGLLLRAATADDASQLALWNRELIEDEGHDNAMSIGELEARMRIWLTTEYRAIVFEEPAASGLRGYALFRDTPEWIHLRQFFVARDCRRRGIGARAVALLRGTVFAPDKPVLVEAMTWNHAALSFWRAVGFADRYVGLESRPAAARPLPRRASS